jgi:hypothetical protein
VTSSRSLARRFRPGLDYTVAHYGILTQAARLDATLAFCDDACESAREAWQSGEVGGFECYLTADEAGEAAGAADVYRADPEAAEEDQVLSVSAAANTLSLVHRCVLRCAHSALLRSVRFACTHAAVIVTVTAPYSRRSQFVPSARAGATWLVRLLRRLRPHVALSEQSFALIPIQHTPSVARCCACPHLANASFFCKTATKASCASSATCPPRRRARAGT